MENSKENYMSKFIRFYLFRFKLSLLIMVLCWVSCKKEFEAEPQSQTFKYNPYGLTNIEDYIVGNNGTQYYLGSTFGIPVLIKTDANGTLLWQHQWDWLLGATNIIENKDQSLLIVGNDYIDTGLSVGYNFKIAKISNEGQLLNKISYLFSKRDTVTVANEETLEFLDSYTSDAKGGYFFPVQYNYSEYYILHYNSDDKIDKSVHLNDPSNFYNLISVLFLEENLSSNGGLILAYYKPSNTSYVIEEIDTSKYFQGEIKLKWRTAPVIPNFYFSFTNNIVADEKFIYHSTIETELGNKKTLGIRILKLEKATGKTIHSWLVPMEHSLITSYPQLVNRMLIEGNNLYSMLGVANNIYLVKSNTDGTDFWTKQLGGKISDENLGILRLVGKDLNVFAFNTNNRSLENILFMCRLNADGQILLK